MYRYLFSKERCIRVQTWDENELGTNQAYALIEVSVPDGSQVDQIRFRSLPELFNLYRAIGEALDALCPGLCSPVPEPNVEAEKITYEADRLQRGL